jgi:predicted DNA-binding transcriptional regulator AlpA
MMLFYCESCRKNTVFLTISKTIEFTLVSRSTIYHWMDREWIHWRELPSGRRVICRESLSHSVRPGSAPAEVERKISS